MEPLVSINFMTYNNAPYIKDAMDGFLTQVINFPAEICVYDDGSTDGTQDILREYEEKEPNVLKIIYQKENQASKGVNVFKEFQEPRFKGKYIALCDPYDYWFHAGKLNIQITYMEKHKNCACSFHSAVMRDEAQSGYILGIDQVWPDVRDIFADEFMIPSPFWFSKSSMVYRADIGKDWPPFRQVNDINAETLKYHLISRGHFHYFPDIMSVHRVNIPGTLEYKLDTDAKFAEYYYISSLKWLYEFNLTTKGEYVLLVGANMQNHIMSLNELNVLQNYSWLLNILVQTEDRIKNLEELKADADTGKSKKAGKKYKIAQKEYWSWYVKEIGENAKAHAFKEG